MIRTRVIPCLLLKGLGLVKTVKFENPRYVGDPINAVRIFNEKEVHELLFLDILATPEGRGPSLEMIGKITSECFMPLGYGGGIRNLADMDAIFRLGVEKIVINTKAAVEPSLVRDAARRFGSQSVVVSIDAKKTCKGSYESFTMNGQHATGKDPVLYAQEMESMGAGEIIITSIDNDGTMQGYDLDLIRSVSSTVTIPVIACGGAGSVQDFTRAVHEAGATAVAAGSMFVFYGKHHAVLINFPSNTELRGALEMDVGGKQYV